MDVSDKGGEKLSKRYEENVRDMIRRRGKANKYEAPGIYCIKLNGRIVYIGKSVNMIDRVAAHYVGIQSQSERKYQIIWDVAQKRECRIQFDVLYYAKEKNYDDILEEIGQKEGELIRQHRPLLNTQIPKAENWRHWDIEKRDTEEIMRLLLDD